MDERIGLDLTPALRAGRKPFITIVVFAAILLLAVASSTVSAQAPTPPAGVTDDQVNAIAKSLYCPVCENIPLDVCPTQACAQWRDLIREKLALGWDEQQIKDYFALQYGDRVLAEPPRRGLNWLVYVLPPVTFLAGAVVLYFVLGPRARRGRSSRPAGVQSFDSAPSGQATPGQASPGQAPARQGSSPVRPVEAGDAQGSNHHPSDEYLRRIEEELRKREQ